MNNGEKAVLVPGSSKVKLTGSLAQQAKVEEILNAMTEVVTIVKLSDYSGNAKVKDKRGICFYCNPDDLKPWYAYSLN